jgi:hypothetical protein
MIKTLVNRRAFSLTEKHVHQINRKLQNFSIDRKTYLYSRRKSQNLEKLYNEMASSFRPKINKVEKQRKESLEVQKQHRRNRAQRLIDYASQPTNENGG